MNIGIYQKSFKEEKTIVLIMYDRSKGYFDTIAAAGELVLDSAGGISANVQTLKSLSEMYTLLGDIHNEIVTKMIRASVAKNEQEFDNVLYFVSSANALEGTIRFNKWCNSLQQVGNALEPLGLDHLLPNEQKQDWIILIHELKNRERAVSTLYEKNLFDLKALAHDHSIGFSERKKRAKDIYLELGKQKAKFDILAKKAEARMMH